MEVLEGVTNVLKEEVRDEMMKQVGRTVVLLILMLSSWFGNDMEVLEEVANVMQEEVMDDEMLKQGGGFLY